MTSKPSPGKKPLAKAGPSPSGKAKASADNIRKMKPGEAAASGKRPAPGGKPAAPAAAKPGAPTGKPGAPAARGPAPSAPAVTPSHRAGRMSKRGSKRDMGLPSNLSKQITGLDEVVEREKKREQFAAAQASGASIKTTDRATRETRKVYALLGIVVVSLVGVFGFIIVRGWFMPPSQEELAEVNVWCGTKMSVALRRVSAVQIQQELKGRSLTEDEKRRLIKTKILDQVKYLQAKIEKEIDAVNNSSASRSREELMQDKRALTLLASFKDAYDRPWQIEFDNKEFVILKSTGGNQVDDSGPGAHDPKPKTDDQVVSALIPFKPQGPLVVPTASTDVPIAPVFDPTRETGDGPPPAGPGGPGRNNVLDSEGYQGMREHYGANKDEHKPSQPADANPGKPWVPQATGENLPPGVRKPPPAPPPTAPQ